MPLNSDLSVQPYSDDFDERKNFSKILFKPGPAVQTRELNQLQTLLQTQIERFGDNILRRGTIVDGCQFSFYENYDYVKLNDADQTGEAINVTNFKGLFVTNEATGVTARISDVAQGFEATFPNLNTLFVSYTKAGNLPGENTFNYNDQLLVTTLDRDINSVNVLNNVNGFSNTDSVVFTPAILVQNSTGGTAFSNGTSISDAYVVGSEIVQVLPWTTARGIITEANTTYNPGAVLVKMRPLANSLVGNNYSNGTFLAENSFTANASFPVSVGGAESFVIDVIGSGAIARVQTSTSGRVLDGANSIVVQDGGEGYLVAPTVSIASGTANTTQVTSLQIEARNYLARVTVANTSMEAIGRGYAFGVSDGVIYQKGYFSRVEAQTVVVEKYHNVPNELSIGFDTTEVVVNSNTDYSLLDISGTNNAAAPGADRLALYPTLVVSNKADAAANTDFFSIVEFSAGIPYKQIRDTQYNTIEDKMAQRTFESAGDFVLDQFLVTPVSETTIAADATTFRVAVDPGAGYVRGRRVETTNNYVTSVAKGTDVSVANDVNVDVNLGSYVIVNELGGTFYSSRHLGVDLRSAARQWGSTGTGGTISAAGSSIGNARVRGVTLHSGTIGSPSAQYKVYLFDVKMNAGKNFSDVKSIYVAGSASVPRAIADVVGTATLREPANSSMLFATKSIATKQLLGNVEFTTRDLLVNTAANGISSDVTFSISAGANAFFPYSGVLTDQQLTDIIVVPNANVIANSAIAGTVSGTSGQKVITGSGTSFSTVLYPGAAVSLPSGIYRVDSIANNTSLTLAANLTAAHTGVSMNMALLGQVPVPLQLIPGAGAAVQANTTLNIGVGFISQDPSWTATITYNKNRRQAPNFASKAIRRKAFVRIDTATHTDGIDGSWCLGLPDVFRLRAVYRANAAWPTVSGENIVDWFYVDNNQNENYLDHGYLVKIPGTPQLAANDRLLVEIDVYQNPADRPFTINSYNIDDTAGMDSTIAAHTAEVPQFYAIRGDYYDLRDYIDFRPVIAATANVNATATTATVNPAETKNFLNSVDHVVPAPQSDIKIATESYMGRIDLVTMSANGDIEIVRGYPGSAPATPTSPEGSLVLDIVQVLPYPSVPKELSTEVRNMYETKTGSERILYDRQNRFAVRSSDNYRLNMAQPKRYTMAELSGMERRLINVEKAVSLTLVEQNIADLMIPSSVDPNEVRFKFGFAVDNFEGLTLSDITNPQFNATIFNGVLAPLKKELRVSYIDRTGTKQSTLPVAEEVVILSQKSATDGPVVLPEPPIPVPPPPPPPPPPPAPIPPISLTTEGDVAHVCGLTPGAVVNITVKNPKTGDTYMQVTKTAGPDGCVEAPVITYPPPPAPPPVVINPPVVSPPPVVVPPPQIIITPTPPPVQTLPVPPEIILPLPSPEPIKVIGKGGGGGGGGGGGYGGGGGGIGWIDYPVVSVWGAVLAGGGRRYETEYITIAHH